MSEQIITGIISIVDADGTALLEPQPAKICWVTHDDGRWEIKFATSHQFHVPGQQAVWLRFVDSSANSSAAARGARRCSNHSGYRGRIGVLLAKEPE